MSPARPLNRQNFPSVYLEAGPDKYLAVPSTLLVLLCQRHLNLTVTSSVVYRPHNGGVDLNGLTLLGLSCSAVFGDKPLKLSSILSPVTGLQVCPKRVIRPLIFDPNVKCFLSPHNGNAVLYRVDPFMAKLLYRFRGQTTQILEYFFPQNGTAGFSSKGL